MPKPDKREAKLKAALMKLVRRQLPAFIVLAHGDVRKSGIPDWSITGNHVTSWWEFKHATPEFKSQDLQTLTCMQLNAQGFCRYIVWWEDSNGLNKRTLLVHPKQIHERQGWILTALDACRDFDHQWVVDIIKRVHHV